MTAAQTSLYFREWGRVRAVCVASGQPVPDRHALHRQALGYDASSKRFTNAEFDKVLGEFRAISQPESVDAQMRQQAQPLARVHWKIRDTLKCLALYPLSKPMGLEGARAYAGEFLRDFVDRGSWRNVTAIEDLSDQPGCREDSDGTLRETPSQVDVLLMTLSARLNEFRNQAGHSLHEMKLAAGVKCRCKLICMRGAAPVRVSKKAAVAEANPF